MLHKIQVSTLSDEVNDEKFQNGLIYVNNGVFLVMQNCHFYPFIRIADNRKVL